jgi:hypothetical protein
MCLLLPALACSSTALAQSWYNADVHLHANGCNNNNRSAAEILGLMQEEGIHIGSILVWGGGRSLELDPVHFRGQEDDPVSLPDYIAHWDIEISLLPGSWNGHMDLLNVAQTDAVVPNQVNYPGQDYLLPNYHYVQSYGGIVGYDHADAWPPRDYGVPSGCCDPRELPLDVALARVDFLAGQQLNQGLFWLWYSMLNAGFHLPILGTSDLGCFWNEVGRFHAAFPLPAGDTLTYTKFIEVVREGRTVIRKNESPAPDFLDIRVNGVGLGGELVLPEENTIVNVQVDASGVASANRRVQLILNGTVFDSQAITSSVQTYEWAVPLDKSSWIAAKTPGAHTAATFVLLGGCPIRNNPASARRWKDYLDAYYDAGVSGDHFGASAAEVREKVDEAKQVWERIAQEGEGSVAMDCSPGTPDFTINAGLNGNWWNGLDRNGEGVQVEVADGGDGSLVFVSTAYSYDPMGNQIFLVAVGPVDGNTAEVDVFITDGGLWGAGFDPVLVNETQWGGGTFTASSCEAMHMSLMPNAGFQAMGYTDLAYDLVRLTTPAAQCPSENPN